MVQKSIALHTRLGEKGKGFAIQNKNKTKKNENFTLIHLCLYKQSAMTWINSKRYRGLFLTILKTSDSKMLILALVFDKSFLDTSSHDGRGKAG